MEKSQSQNKENGEFQSPNLKVKHNSNFDALHINQPDLLKIQSFEANGNNLQMAEMEFNNQDKSQCDPYIYEEEYYSERNEDALVDEIFGKGEHEIIINAENGGTGDLQSSKN